MILLFLLSASAEIVSQCKLIEDGYVLSKYYTDWCPSCQKLGPVVEEIANRVERHEVGLKIRNVDCDECECKAIESYPTLELTKDGKSLGMLKGAQDYDAVVKFILEHMSGIGEDVFAGHVKRKEAVVEQLTRTDFLSGFDGPHVVLFYSRKDDRYREMFKELAKNYDGRLRVGEISSAESEDLVSRYDIRKYPSVSGIFNGLVVPFLGEDDLQSLTVFCDELIEPSFQNITLNKFNDVVAGLESGEPIYVVFHKNLALASAYFQKMAHMYKFKAKIYRSDDPHLFEKASIFPRELGSGEDHSTSSNHADVIILSVYKNGIFYRYTDAFGDEEKIANWIFNTHYRYLTRISNQNFHSVFHGLKPAMILLTRGEQFVDKMDEFSADRHLGVPYTNMVFATMEIDDYPLFIPTLLPGIEAPAIVVFEPWANLFYHKRVRLTENSFVSSAMDVYTAHQEGRLQLYPSRRSKRLWYVLASIFALLSVVFCTARTNMMRKNK